MPEGQSQDYVLLANVLDASRNASITDLIEGATLREMKRLQRKYNRGKKWSGVPVGALRPGRCTREEIQHRNEDK